MYEHGGKAGRNWRFNDEQGSVATWNAAWCHSSWYACHAALQGKSSAGILRLAVHRPSLSLANVPEVVHLCPSNSTYPGPFQRQTAAGCSPATAEHAVPGCVGRVVLGKAYV